MTAAALEAKIDVYLHTNGDWRKPPRDASGFRVHNGWYKHANISALRNQFDCCLRAPWNLNAVYKYDWMLQESVTARSGDPHWLGLLMDTDVLIQCSAAELRHRFERLKIPLVIGGERRWFPIPRKARDPFGPSLNFSWRDRYEMRHTRQYYPNSGLLMGTAEGFEMLGRAVHATPRFPCCSYEGEPFGFQLDPCNSCRPPRRFDSPVPCAVDDQTW